MTHIGSMENKRALLQVSVWGFPVELRHEVKVRAVTRGETMAEWLARAARNQMRLEDGLGVEEVPALPLSECGPAVERT